MDISSPAFDGTRRWIPQVYEYEYSQGYSHTKIQPDKITCMHGKFGHEATFGIELSVAE